MLLNLWDPCSQRRKKRSPSRGGATFEGHGDWKKTRRSRLSKPNESKPPRKAKKGKKKNFTDSKCRGGVRTQGSPFTGEQRKKKPPPNGRPPLKWAVSEVKSSSPKHLAETTKNWKKENVQLSLRLRGKTSGSGNQGQGTCQHENSNYIFGTGTWP